MAGWAWVVIVLVWVALVALVIHWCVRAPERPDDGSDEERFFLRVRPVEDDRG